MFERYGITLGIPLCLFLLLLSGCSQTEVREPVKQVRAVPYSIATTGDTGVDISRATTYTWAPAMNGARSGAYLGNTPVDRFIQVALDNAMTARGYRFSQTGNEHGLLVDYHVVLGDKPDSVRLGNQYGINPGLAAATPGGDRYTRGTLVITVVDSKTGRTARRSALQGFADLEIPAHVRQQRINNIVASMLAGLPARSQSTR